MGDIEQRWLTSPSRRKALVRMAGLAAASPLGAALAQSDPRPLSEHRRAPTLAEMQTAFDFEPVFFGNVPLRVYDYTAHGEGSEFTLRRNRQAFEWVDIVPTRAPIPEGQVDLSSELLGATLKFPIIVAPTATMIPVHPDGEIGMYQAATAASHTLMILSHNTSTPVAKVAPAVTGGQLWGQFYPNPSTEVTQRAMDAYQSAGCGCVVVTVDQTAAFYERSQQSRNFGGVVRAATAPAASAAPSGTARYRLNDGRLWYTWQYLDAVRKMVKGKLLVKGIERADDATRALQHGVDGIIVSNHGGRSMDYGASTLEVLPEIVAAVNGKVPVLFDSGVRRGADVFKALSLGAKAVMIGRATRWGLGAYGAAGAQRVIEILQQELVQTAAAAGCARLSDINKTATKVNFV